jgi:hypothetical protein
MVALIILDRTSGLNNITFPHLQGMQYNPGVFRPTSFTGQEAGRFVTGMRTNFMLSVDSTLSLWLKVFAQRAGYRLCAGVWAYGWYN